MELATCEVLGYEIDILSIADVYLISVTNAFDMDVCVCDQMASECVINNFPSRGNNKWKPLYLHWINDDHFSGVKLTSGSDGDFLVNSSKDLVNAFGDLFIMKSRKIRTTGQSRSWTHPNSKIAHQRRYIPFQPLRMMSGRFSIWL